VLWLMGVGYHFLNPAAAEGRSFFHHIYKTKLESIELTSLDNNGIRGSTMVIVDQRDLATFQTAWLGVDTVLPNHPRYLWSMIVKFRTAKGIYAGVLSATSNQGVLFHFDTSPVGWPVSSDYQLIGTTGHMEAVVRSLTVVYGGHSDFK
jgi:hypothetical protein